MNLKPNTAAPGVPFYTPYQDPPSGTAQPTKDEADKPVPTVFTPLRIRSITLPNRFVVSPMCMYSADEGHLTDFHLVHLGQFALRGAGLTIIEATAVTPNGRISPQDSGIWADTHIAALKRVTDYVHSQGHLIGIQIGHAGRKASTRAPWLVAVPGHNEVAKSGDVEKGWEDDVVAPSALKWAEGYAMPKEITREEIKDVVEAFRLGAERAVKAGVDMIEIHAAHGYLLTQFLSPVTNVSMTVGLSHYTLRAKVSPEMSAGGLAPPRASRER